MYAVAAPFPKAIKKEKNPRANTFTFSFPAACYQFVSEALFAKYALNLVTILLKGVYLTACH